MITEVYIKVKHNCPYSQLSEKMGRKQFYAYCNDQFDMVMVDGQISENEISEVKSLFHLSKDPYHTTLENSLFNYIIIDCDCVNYISVSGIIQNNKGIPNGPVKYVDGWEYHRFVALDKSIISNVLKELGEHFPFEIISTKKQCDEPPLKLGGVPTNQLLGALTDAQISILVQAYQEGYYKIPRTVKLKDVSESLGVTRQAVEGRLRRAENAIMNLIIPLLDFEQFKSISEEKEITLELT